MCAVFDAPRPANLTVQDVHITGPSGALLGIRKYIPQNPRETAILFSHGGGFVVGSLDSHDMICAYLADKTGCELWASDYRLAPENQYPAALDDVECVWNKLTENGRAAVVVGDSAGGNLSAALCMRLRRKNRPSPRAQVLIYPGLGGPSDLPSRIENAEAPMLRTQDIEFYAQIYGATANDPESAPLACKDFRGLPAAFIVTADVDPLRDDGPLFATHLKSAGVDVQLRNEPELVHGYLRALDQSPRVQASVQAIVEYIRQWTLS